MEAIGTLIPVEGSELAAGRTTVTVTSRGSGNHITLTLRASLHGADTVRAADASLIAVEDYDGLRLATYFPAAGMIAWVEGISDAEKWAIRGVLRWCAGDKAIERHADIDVEERQLVA